MDGDQVSSIALAVASTIAATGLLATFIAVILWSGCAVNIILAEYVDRAYCSGSVCTTIFATTFLLVPYLQVRA